MRRNSGRDESRDGFLAPTTKERERAQGKSGAAISDRRAQEGTIEDNARQRTTGMGSHDRKSGHKGG